MACAPDDDPLRRCRTGALTTKGGMGETLPLLARPCLGYLPGTRGLTHLPVRGRCIRQVHKIFRLDPGAPWRAAAGTW
jgi:hypothetical protein